jgi:anaerobic ribonucleoside-triphosphate reductase activating protein
MLAVDHRHESVEILRIAQRTDRCSVLGPGMRAILWVQGCPFRCLGCVAPETLPFVGGEEIPVAELARHLLGLADIEGITFSGGEPMSQATPLVGLIDQLVAERPELTFMSYTGHTLDYLLEHGTRSQLELLSRLDLLIDGPYIKGQHTDLRWRGSDNQQVHFLSARYRHLQPVVHDRGTFIEFELLPDGGLRWMGIPPMGFREMLPAALSQLGIELATTEDGR